MHRVCLFIEFVNTIQKNNRGIRIKNKEVFFAIKKKIIKRIERVNAYQM